MAGPSSRIYFAGTLKGQDFLQPCPLKIKMFTLTACILGPLNLTYVFLHSIHIRDTTEKKQLNLEWIFYICFTYTQTQESKNSITL